jgi:release factor glutamine methyltransferase
MDLLEFNNRLGAHFSYDEIKILFKELRSFHQKNPIQWEHIVERLIQHEPIDYILRSKPFYNHVFEVSKDTLIPRPETEELVDLMIHSHDPKSNMRILDIGTGSGCIAISLALAFPESKIIGIDISPEAIAIAKKNAQHLKAFNVQFEVNDILNPHSNDSMGMFDLIVSNPPYIAQREKANMTDSVVQFEPHLALFVPDDNPLMFYQAIHTFAETHLSKNGIIYCETSQYLQYQDHKGFEIELRKDYSQHIRFSISRKID